MTVALTRAQTATLVVVGPHDRLADAASTLGAMDEAGSMRSVLISTPSSETAPLPRGDDLTITSVRPEHLNNAIATMRLSSLPTVIWWRGGPPARLDSVAPLADRVLLDAEDPAPLWRRVPALFEHAAITDLRWTRLTRWRSTMAHFFDLPQVREAAASFTDLTLAGSDRALCTLFAAWLDASLGWKGRVAVQFTQAEPRAPMTDVLLSGPSCEVSLRLLPNSTCLEARARVEEHVLATRVLSLGDEGLPALLRQERRVRSRDIAFERAILSVASLGL
jgi:glucose-6-phosphate dehydrogenase assembly protein OpcA